MVFSNFTWQMVLVGNVGDNLSPLSHFIRFDAYRDKSVLTCWT